MKKTLSSISIAAVLASAAGVATAATVTIPNSFSAGTPAVAAQVNGNFSAVKTAVDGNAGDIATNTANISTNTTDIGTNTANISTNTTNITANTTAINTANTAITALQAAGACPADMVAAGSICIDKYEGSIWNAATGGAQFIPPASAPGTGTSGTDTASFFPCVRDGSDCAEGAPAAATPPSSPIYARSVAGVTPAINITWYQAAQACANVGKRLPTTAEWQLAASGTPSGLNDGTNGCNINTSNTLGMTGNAASCVSTAGALDMVGNAMEWTADLSILDIGFKDMSAANPASPGGAASVFAWALGNGFGNTAGGVPSVYAVFAPNDGTIAVNTQIGFRCAK